MNFDEIKITDEDFDKIATKGYLKTRPFNLNMAKEILAIKDEQEESKESYWTTLKFLSMLLDVHQNHANKDTPFGPIVVFGDNRTLIPSDITSEQAQVLFKNIGKIEAPYIKAKIADILWVSKKLDKNNIKAAEVAIGAYQESVNLFISRHSEYEFAFLHAWQDLNRLSVLIQSIKKQNVRDDFYQQLLGYFANSTIFDNNKNKVFFVVVCEILLNYNLTPDEAKEVINIIKDFLNKDLKGMPLYNLRKIYDVAIGLSRKIKSNEDLYYFGEIKAESYVLESEHRSDPIGKAHFLRDAIIAYNGIPNKEKRIGTLKNQLSSVRPDIRKNMVEIDIGPIDVKEEVKKMSEDISGVTLEEAIIRWLSYFDLFPTYEQQLEEARKNVGKYLFDIFSVEAHDEDGNVIYKNPNNTEEERFENILLQNLQHITNFYGQVFVINGITSLSREHCISYEKILEIIKDSPFIPLGHYKIFAKAFYYFLKFDMLEATILLSTQIENSLRYILQSYTNTDVIRSDGCELSLIDMDRLFVLCKNFETLTKTEIFYLEKILTHPLFSIRHRIAHGKAKDTIGNNIYSIILCFLVFYLAMRHKMNDYYNNNPSLNKINMINPDINKYIEAIDIFINENRNLLCSSGYDITIICKLADVLQRFYCCLDVDAKYNHYVDVTKIEENHTDLCLIVHKRFSDEENLLICEIKQQNEANSADCTISQERIKNMTKKDRKHNYNYGCFLLINTACDKIISFWYEDGQAISSIEHVLS